MSSNRRNSKQDEREVKPGTSSSMFPDGAAGGRRLSSGDENDRSQEQSPSSVKARNASRDRPVRESVESKRLKVSEDDDDDDDDDELRDGMEIEENEIVRGMPMDTDASEDSDVPGRENNETVNIATGETGSIPENVETAKINSRRNSAADENVSTTMQSSSLRYGSLFTPGVKRESTFVLDQAVASTSAAAMAPPLSRIMEESPVLNEVYRHSVVYSPDDIANSPSTHQATAADRSAAPTMSGQGRNRNLSRSTNENVDVNENQGPDMSLHKMHGKQRLMWARKLFFVSTELVFPGFTAYSDNKGKMADYLGVRVRSSCAMQGLLYADALFFIMWILSFLSTCDILITVLKQLHGYLSICLTCLFILVNAIRLRFGLKGNENDEVQYLALFWMITVIVQIPLFTFIFLTDLFCPVLMAFTVTMDSAMMIFILLESIVGFIHFRSLLRDEMNIVRMAKRSKEARASTANQRQEEPPRVPQAPASNPNFDDRNTGDRHESDSSNTDSEVDNDPVGVNPDGSMDFQMQIRRLSESRRNENQDDSASDSSEQVTSTSDTIRQRPIRAH